MEIRVLCIGDIVGGPGREAVAELLPGLKEEFEPDLIIANAENATHGKGVSFEHYKELSKLGIDMFTSGDHIWQSPDIVPDLDNPNVAVIRPANYAGAPGKGFRDITVKGKRVRVINLMGRVFTGANVENPFHTLDAILDEHGYDIAIIDFHGEATSEKRMLAEYADGRASLIFGTHTHVPTADAQVLPQGSGFITDLGMVGPRDSSLGADKDSVLKNFLTGLPWRYSLASGQCELGAAFCIIDAGSKQALRIEHIRRFTTNQ
jgi:2',3'-cyclic-nucleotide 2'-phosphodiesterase